MVDESCNKMQDQYKEFPSPLGLNILFPERIINKVTQQQFTIQVLLMTDLYSSTIIPIQ